jgi:hypothetical protein
LKVLSWINWDVPVIRRACSRTVKLAISLKLQSLSCSPLVLEGKLTPTTMISSLFLVLAILQLIVLSSASPDSFFYLTRGSLHERRLAVSRNNDSFSVLADDYTCAPGSKSRMHTEMLMCLTNVQDLVTTKHAVVVRICFLVKLESVYTDLSFSIWKLRLRLHLLRQRLYQQLRCCRRVRQRLN